MSKFEPATQDAERTSSEEPSLEGGDDVEDVDSPSSLTSQTLNADGTPKRPMNAFMIFARRRRPQLSAENQQMRTGEISKILSKEWNAMTSADKQFYLDQAKQLKERFNSKYPEYVYRRRPNNSRKKRRTDPVPNLPPPPPAQKDDDGRGPGGDSFADWERGSGGSGGWRSGSGYPPPFSPASASSTSSYGSSGYFPGAGGGGSSASHHSSHHTHHSSAYPPPPPPPTATNPNPYPHQTQHHRIASPYDSRPYPPTSSSSYLRDTSFLRESASTSLFPPSSSFLRDSGAGSGGLYPRSGAGGGGYGGSHSPPPPPPATSAGSYWREK